MTKWKIAVVTLVLGLLALGIYQGAFTTSSDEIYLRVAEEYGLTKEQAIVTLSYERIRVLEDALRTTALHLGLNPEETIRRHKQNLMKNVDPAEFRKDPEKTLRKYVISLFP